MKRCTLLASAYLVDRVAGDPEWFPHPVRLMGAATFHGEAALRRPGQSATTEFMAGAALTGMVVGCSYFLAQQSLRIVYARSPVASRALEVLLAWTCLAGRNLQDEAIAVLLALDADDLPHARVRLARIVGRDTTELAVAEVSRAVIETLAESASDGVVAPMFYLALGGVPLAMAYKAVNTLDSMIGHADERYFYFGKFAARLDDAANYIPARLTAAAIIASAVLSQQANGGAALHTWRRDGDKHKSPNAGQPESAMAGALQVRLGGPNTYAGELIAGPVIGREFAAPDPARARDAARLVGMASLLMLAGLCLASAKVWKR